MDNIYELHRYLAFVALAFALVHPAILFAKDPKYWPLLNIFTSPPRAKFAVAAVLALVALVALSVWREKLIKRYRVWKWGHAVLALVVVVGSMAHAVLVNYYLRDRWQQLAWLVLSMLFLLVGIWVRIVQPTLRLRRRWRVKSNTPGAAETNRLELELVDPKSYGPKGFAFKPGQFAWLTAKRSPFSLTSNPFSICSSAQTRDRISFTIKTQTGITTEVTELKPGDVVYVDGPHGTFHWHEQAANASTLFIAAGVGITPILSMLESLADQGNLGHHFLWLANRDQANIIGHPQLVALQSRLKLSITHVLSQQTGATLPPEDAQLQYVTGRLDVSRVQSLFLALPQEVMQSCAVYMCGPNAFMDSVNAALLSKGVPRTRIFFEKFAMN